MKQASFSVIIPVYNVEKYIARALDSVLAQNYDNMEILCMDDKSPDSSAEIISEYTMRDARIKLIKSDENAGLGAVRNRGMRLAQNDWILFLDSDDWFEPGLFHKLNEIIQNSPNINIIEFQFNLTYPIEQTNKYVQAGWLNRGEAGLRKTENENILLTVYVWNKCWRHNFLIKHNLENNETRKYAEDVVFTVSAFILAQEFYYLNYIGYNWFYNSKSITRSPDNNFYANVINVFLKPLEMDLKKFGVYSDELYHCMIICMLGWWVPLLVFPRDKKAYKTARRILRSFPYIPEGSIKTKIVYDHRLYSYVRRSPYWLYRPWSWLWLWDKLWYTVWLKYKQVKGLLYGVLQMIYRVILPKKIRNRIWVTRNHHV